MKRKVLITLLLISIIMILAITVKALEGTITIEGNQTAKAGENVEKYISVNSDILVGGLTGKIEISGEIESIKCEGINGWTLIAYNEETGEFVAYCAAGTTSGNIIKITAIMKENAQEESTGSITLTKLEQTTIPDYTIEEVSDQTTIIKIIKDVEEPENNTVDNNVNNNIVNNNIENNNINNNTNNNIDNNTNNNTIDNKIHNNTTNNNTTKNNTVVQTNKASTAILPKTGSSIVILLIIGLVSVNALILYRKYKIF